MHVFRYDRAKAHLQRFRHAFRIPAAVLAVAGLAACASGGSGSSGSSADTPLSRPAKTPGSVKVALLLPLTGNPNAQGVAKAMKQAAELALFDFKKPNVQLISKDTRGTPDGARAAAQDAVKEGADLIAGPLFAGEVSAVAPIAQSANVPVLAFSSDRSVGGNGVYLLSFVPGGEASRIVSYAAAKGKTRFAGLFPQTEYGKLAEQAFTKAVQDNRGELIATKAFPSEINGMLAPAKEIAALGKKGSPSKIDALFIPVGVDLMPSLSPLLPYYDLDTQAVKLLGGAQWDFPGVGKDALVGGWFAAPDPKGWQDFSKRYQDTYSETPPRLAAQAYDAMSLAISLSNTGTRFSTAELTRPTGFAGVEGLFRLRPDGTAERGFAIVEVGKSGNQVVDPAPSSFGTAVAQY